MAMRDADKDRRKNRPIYHPSSSGHESMSLQDYKKQLVDERDKWEQRAKENEEAALQLTQANERIQAEQAQYQQALSLYNQEQAKADELISQRNEWEKRAKENEEAASQLVKVQQSLQTYGIQVKELEEKITENEIIYIQEHKKYQEVTSQFVQVQQDIHTYKIEADKLEESVKQNYQMYLEEQGNYQQTIALYNQEKARASELLAKYEEVSSERDNYVILYNEAKSELKFERRSKASIKGWETRRKSENEKLKREISEMVALLQKSLASKDEAISNLYIVAERMDRIQSLVDFAEDETTNNPLGMVQKFKRIWSAIKEILSE
jgi:chromosome segregation ATPase